ncbi:MAG: LysR substrate-binding domain-containing protein [Treponema sp.]|nr:LysR substrate-binding domain-containing protein [Treponema sp.]
MNFYEMEAFVRLSRELHFGKAASALNMSPSALSRVITRLEEELHTVLLDRSNRQVILTPEGEKFRVFAVQSLAGMKNLKDSLEDEGSEEITGTLPLYASVTACYTILPRFVRQLNQRYPKVKISVETGDPAGALASVRDGRCLLAVAAIPEEGLSTMETVVMEHTPLVYAACKNGPYTEVYGSPQDIVSTVPLILPKAGLARKRFDKWTKSRNVHPVIAAETEGNEAILALAQLGLGIGLVPRIVLENGPYKGEFIIHEAGNALGHYDVGFIYKKDITGTTSQKKLGAVVRNILETM